MKIETDLMSKFLAFINSIPLPLGMDYVGWP